MSPTGYEVHMYRHIEVAAQALRELVKEARRIANVLETQEMRAREKHVDPDSLGAMALWREEVARGNCRIGFADWLAWHQHDEEAGTTTTPEEIEALAPAIAAVKRGMAALEQAVENEAKEER